MASYQFHIVMLEVCNMSILRHTYYVINLIFYFHLSNNSCSHSNFMNKQHHNFYLCCNFMNKQHHRFYSVATLALGSQPRQRGYKVAGQEQGSPGVKAKALQGCGPRGSRGVTSHTPGSVRKCEGVWGSEPSHSQGNSHFGRWNPGGLPKL